MLCAVLEIISVAVRLDLLPLGSHVGRGIDEVVLGTEIVDVVGLVNGMHLVEECVERLALAVLTDERRKRLVQFVKRLEAREDEIRPLQPLAHGI